MRYLARGKGVEGGQGAERRKRRKDGNGKFLELSFARGVCLIVIGKSIWSLFSGGERCGGGPRSIGVVMFGSGGENVTNVVLSHQTLPPQPLTTVTTWFSPFFFWPRGSKGPFLPCETRPLTMSEIKVSLCTCTEYLIV